MSDSDSGDENINADDGAGFLEAFEEADRECDDDVHAYYDALTPEVIGRGYFGQRMRRIHDDIGIDQSRTFYSVPHRSELSPILLPERNPIRPLAWVLHQAPENLTVRVNCYILTCPFAIDLLIYHGGNKNMNVIMHPSRQTTRLLQEFFNDHGRVAMHAFRNRLNVRVANVDIPLGGRFTQMHDKSIITDTHTTFGSYNLTNPGRYQNWESFHVADSEPSHSAHFDSIWNSLAGRDLQSVYPGLAPPSRISLEV
eukprot:scaffold70507_cov62-Attheya_sp.AAC.1